MNRDETWLLTEKYHGEKTEGFFADCTRLRAGEPLAYVIGHVPFLNTTIYLDSRPLIPRTETEYWVEKVLTQIDRGLASVRVLDLCAGSGCIGVAVLKALPMSRVDFEEIDTGHHPTIKKNIETNGINLLRTHIYSGNLFENISNTYDYILTNPPYIDNSLERTEKSVLEYEPHQALFADDAGFSFIERIIREAPSHLTEKGVLAIEHEPEHVLLIQTCAHNSGLASKTENDQYGVPRYTIFTPR